MRLHQIVIALWLMAAPATCTARQDGSPDATPLREAASAQRPVPAEVTDRMASFARMVGGEWHRPALTRISMSDTWHWGPGKHSTRGVGYADQVQGGAGGRSLASFCDIQGGWIGQNNLNVDPQLEIKGGQFTNATSMRIGRGSLDVVDGGTGTTRALFIGSGNGPGAMRVTGNASSFEALHTLAVGDTTAGTLEIDRGLFSFSVTPTSLTPTPRIGWNAPGTVTVRGDDSSLVSYGHFDVDNSLVVGDGASGRLNVQRGGHVSVSYDLVVGGQRANSDGQLIVDGQGGGNIVDVFRGTFVNATAIQEIVVQDGGRLSTTGLFVGGLQISPGMADVTLRGRSGSFPTLTVGMSGGGGLGTFIGDGVPGLLNVHAGASPELYDGLYVGQLAQGIVSVSGLNHPPGTVSMLTVTGETQVGNGGPGIVQLDAAAQMETNGDMKVGLGGGNPSGSVNLDGVSFLHVNGTLGVGESGIGLLNVLTGSGVRCDTLVVGGNSPGATGIVTTGFFTQLTVDGNAQVGAGAGRGEVHLADPEARLVINGSLTIGNPAGGAGGGAVTLVDARIEGTGNIVVDRNGSLSGTGTVSVPHINAGGIISPGLSPGTLVIDGDLDLLPGGALIIEYAGTNPGEFDVLHVTGEAMLGGQLQVHFRDGFSPENPTEFIQSQDFVEADEDVFGDFARRIYAYPDEFADFDDDGDKDLSDVAEFQNCVGLFGSQLRLECPRADWEFDGLLGGVELRELVARLTGPQ